MDVHPETLRKAGVGIKWASDAGLLNPSPDYAVAKQQYFDQRREFNAMLRREARADHLADVLTAAAQAMNEQHPLLEPYKEDPELDYAEPEEALLVLADWHYGMKASNIWNEYSPEICRERVASLRDQVIERLRLHRIIRLHIFVLGDMVNGAIHTTSRVAAEEAVCEQLMHVSELIAELVSDLADYVQETLIYCTYGNHARTVQNKSDSIHEDNMERIIPWWLEQRLRGRRDVTVTKTAKQELMSAIILGNNVCGVHGDLDSRDAALTLSQMYERAYGRKTHYLISGHLHSLMDTEQLGITSVRAGGLCGTDEFAKNARLFAEPRQTLLTFTEYGLNAIYHMRVGGRRG